RFTEVKSKWLEYEKILRSWLRIRLKPKENDTLRCTSFRSLRRSEGTQLEDRRVGDIVLRDVSGDATRENQNWRLYFTTTIMVLVYIFIFMSSSELHVYIPTCNKVEPCAKSHGITYRVSRYVTFIRPTIGSGAVILDEFFVNPNAWHVKVPLVMYATVKLHKIDGVLRQFEFQQSIPVAPQELDDLNRIDLRRPDEN
ncbi:hypothetical protein Godav_004652, partial [Gossypium davidsonii]|nr:hypothetical protein [Gossypium davidsonii]MBA0662745.1 hypothetical protein [Gossypium klotzschianum]